MKKMCSMREKKGIIYIYMSMVKDSLSKRSKELMQG